MIQSWARLVIFTKIQIQELHFKKSHLGFIFPLNSSYIIHFGCCQFYPDSKFHSAPMFEAGASTKSKRKYQFVKENN